MKKRILLPNGKFANFKGTRELYKAPTLEQKLAEHKEVKEVADKHGFDVANPEDGGLSTEDVNMLNSGEMSLMAVVSLANNRKIEIPEGMEDKAEIIAHMLPKEQLQVPGEKPMVPPTTEGKVLSRMSIPEMRAYAKTHDVKIPGTIKKKVDMCAFLEGSSPVPVVATDDL